MLSTRKINDISKEAQNHLNLIGSGIININELRIFLNSLVSLSPSEEKLKEIIPSVIDVAVISWKLRIQFGLVRAPSLFRVRQYLATGDEGCFDGLKRHKLE